MRKQRWPVKNCYSNFGMAFGMKPNLVIATVKYLTIIIHCNKTKQYAVDVEFCVVVIKSQAEKIIVEGILPQVVDPNDNFSIKHSQSHPTIHRPGNTAPGVHAHCDHKI